MSVIVNQRGMTLVEVAIAATVLAMVFLGLASAMRTFSASYTSLHEVNQRTAELREVNNFLRHSLRESVFTNPGSFRFSGSEVIWMSPLDRIGSAGGVMWLKLARRGEALTLDFAKPKQPGDSSSEESDEPSWGQLIRPQTLLEDVSRLSISARLHSEEDWSGSGDDLVNLPHSVMLEFGLSEGEWPPLIIALDNYREESR